ncbi:MAG TPA: carboxymuconolactone decarboxylase family protein [Acidimicrobiales bacterium]|nr:carboxymuconolactone decarboxylase family protein [Acidimicrobiales bacterium]
MNDRLRRGREKFEELYGEGRAQGLIDMQTGLAQDLARYGIEFNFGDVYSRPGLTLAQREMASLAALVALGGLEPQVRGHTRGAIRAGLSATEILETVIHTVQYAGFPRALNAIRVVTDTLEELGVEIPPPLGPTGPE